MKKIAKKIVFICMLLALSFSAGAQYSSVMAEGNLTDGGKAIVRNMSPTEVVTYVWAGPEQWFTYENSTTLTYKFFQLPSPDFDKNIINDFRIIDGILYFCGADNNSGEGVLGTFKATDLLNPVGSLVQVDYFNIVGTTELNRMEVYKDPGTGNPRVAAVGYDRNGGCSILAQGVWVDCEGYAPGGTPTSVSVFESYCSAPNDVEQWHDVVSTDDWVVLVGYGAVGGQKGIALRRFHKGNLTDPEMDNIYIFNESENVAWAETRAEFIKRNDMAVVYRGERIRNVIDFDKFRIFDIDNMANINSQEYEVPYKSYLWEMAYMPNAKLVVVLSDFPTPAFLSNFAYLEPYQTTTYTSVYVNDDDWSFQSLTNLNGTFFVGAGGFHFLLRDVSASYPANNFYSTTPVYCPSSSTLKVVIIDNIIMNLFPHPISPIPPTINPGFCNPPILPIRSLNVRCLSN